MKVLLRSKDKLVVIDFTGKSMPDPYEVLRMWNQTQGDNMTEAFDLSNIHLCKYCGRLAEGDYEDLLCEDCRETFGHTFYSEL